MNIPVSKETRLNIRVKPSFKDDLQSVAEFHGLTVSSYVHSVLVKAIRAEKEREPQAFENKNPAIITIPDRGKLDDEKAVKGKKVA